jgi:hypothetical protein
LIVLSIQGWFLHDSEPYGIFLGDMQEFSIFSRLSSNPQIEIQSVEYWSSGHSKSFGPFPSDMHEVPIFRRWSTRARMPILITDLESSRKIESDEYDIIDMRGSSIFSSVYF